MSFTGLRYKDYYSMNDPNSNPTSFYLRPAWMDSLQELHDSDPVAFEKGASSSFGDRLLDLLSSGSDSFSALLDKGKANFEANRDTFYRYFAERGLEFDKLSTADGIQSFFRLDDTPVSPAPYTPPKPIKPIEYLNADLAKAYGMNASTAYQEALSNTSYQRAVKDLQDAGLNPVLAATGLSGAGGVYGAKTGNGVSLRAGVSSGHDAYRFLSNAFTIVGALAGYKVGGIKGAVAGATVGNQIGGATGNLFDAMW